MAQTETQPVAAVAAAEETAATTASDATESNETSASATAAEETTTTTETGTTNTDETEEISYHAVEKDGHVTAIWEMQGRRHLRTIDPRSGEGKNILNLFTSEHHDEENAAA